MKIQFITLIKTAQYALKTSPTQFHSLPVTNKSVILNNDKVYKAKKHKSIMKKMYFAMFALFMAVLLTGFVSADRTLVAGTIYDEDIVSGVTQEGANVTITCGEDVLHTVSVAHGAYANAFGYGQCVPGSTVSVHAQYGAKTGDVTATVNNGTAVLPELSLNYAVGNVVLIPEFGLLIGTMTILGALVAFMIIRRK